MCSTIILRIVGNGLAQRVSLMNGAELKVEVIPAVTYCENCKGEYKTVEYGKICPYCQSKNTYLLSGNEIMIKEIEAR